MQLNCRPIQKQNIGIQRPKIIPLVINKHIVNIEQVLLSHLRRDKNIKCEFEQMGNKTLLKKCVYRLYIAYDEEMRAFWWMKISRCFLIL